MSVSTQTLSTDWIVHNDSTCGKLWNPAIIEVQEYEHYDLDGEWYYGLIEIPVNSPRPLSKEYIGLPKSQFSRTVEKMTN